MRSVLTEVRKVHAYRVPMLVAWAIPVLCGLWGYSLIIRGASVESAQHLLDSYLAFGGVLLPVTWFMLPMLLVNGDLHDGTLRPALLANPHPLRVIGAKWIASVITALASAGLVWLFLIGALLLRPDGSAIMVMAVEALPRLLVQATACVILGMGIYLLTGFRGTPWLILGFVVWAQLIERVLGSALPGTAGMLASPLRLIDFWVRMRWSDTQFTELQNIGFIPFAVYATVIALIGAVLYSRYTDRSGRAWSRKEVST